MLLILSHENSDFDAVASQLAAHILYPESVHLLAWRVNRNVEQFLALFWDALEFVRLKDWKRQRVDRVLLVDTHSLPSVRGIRQDKVKVQVIDHHLVAGDKNSTWTYHTEPVGATTTLLVEMLRTAGLTLTANQATLLLLGIHEDTGSLVYDTTTVRDVRAAAWLLEHGAQLSVLRRFLNIPLSYQQQTLYNRLQESLQMLRVEGQTIAFAAVEAPEGFADEISAVAHRLRDSLTPDGLLLLVQLKHNHVQLVARSSTDYVDVSVIARALGGGGHSRAAAATVMDRKLTDVHERVIDLLPEAVRPMAKVAQIMSYGVQTVLSTSPVKAAAEQMQRFGHEGYPVIDPADKQLVGLLTRRAVDRAMSHRLEDMPVYQAMKAGHVTVYPSDSIEQVQHLMIEEGWGQIPVIEEQAEQDDSHNLIGIVTRTDLISLLNDSSRQEEYPDIRKLMATSLSEALWGLVQVVGDVASTMDMPLYFVGGLVRDLVLEKSATDIDMVVEGDAIALVRRLRRRYGGATRSHAQFGTAKWLLSPSVWGMVAPKAPSHSLPQAIDFVTARTEFYTRPSALPEVERGSIKLDLHRRDFTINTLAIRLDGAHMGELLDFYGGRRDLESRKIRVLHSLSFVDDPTRILRAVRLEQRLGFVIESRTAELIGNALHMLNRVTGDRLRNEIEMCLQEGSRVATMARLAELGVLAHIHPGLIWKKQTAGAFQQAETLSATSRWSSVLDEQSPAFIYFAIWLIPHSSSVRSEVMRRLKVRKTTREDVLAIVSVLHELSQIPQNARPSQIVAVLRPYPSRVLLVARAIVNPEAQHSDYLDRYQEEWSTVRTELDGNYLLNMGLEEGPLIGSLLERLLAARLDGEISGVKEERNLLDELLSQVSKS